MARPFSVPLGVLVRRVFACILIVAAAWFCAISAGRIPLFNSALSLADNVFYDAFYRQRLSESRRDGPVVIVAVNDASLAAVNKTFKRGWPWPREFWGHIAEYLDHCHARAVCFDLLFSEASAYNNETGDDDLFSDSIKSLKIPVVFASQLKDDNSWSHFAPAIPHPRFGAAHVESDVMIRSYHPQVGGKPSLAVAALDAVGATPKLSTDKPFLLHYYGPYANPSGTHTFRYISAASVLGAALQGDQAAKDAGITPDLFKDKIVLIGAIATGTYDLKSSPLSREYPGVEVQATAIENLLAGRQVLPVADTASTAAPLCAALIATVGITFPRRASIKILSPILAATVVVIAGDELMLQNQIYWFSPAPSLLAIAISTVAAFGWTYFAEDRQRRFMLKALSKVVSPAVAHQLAREPARLALGTIRCPITVLFTDLANFTDMSESMDVQNLGKLLNRYLGKISDQILAEQGTLDKYIGDALMCFWNAPLPQPDHAARACAAALAIAHAELEILPELQALGAKNILTRIGINTSEAAVGFVGSSHLYNYTALGDGVNLASRLESANKIYGTRILISESTALPARDEFYLRKIDLLRVKGKQQPVAVYELLGSRKRAADNSVDPRIAAYERALALYQSRQWDAAEGELLELIRIVPDDGAARSLVARLAALRQNPPPADWDGVYRATEK